MVESPCNNDCLLEKGVCTGCFRTEEEIIQWTTLTNKEQEKVLERCQKRRDELV